MDFISIKLFLLSAVALLGSPGPAIACLLAVGKTEKKTSQSFLYLFGMLIGLSIAAAISVAGLFSFISAFPSTITIMYVVATVYLLYLAYKIATSPVGTVKETNEKNFSSTVFSGFLIGISNPKAYIAFISLYSAFTLVRNDQQSDTILKLLLTILVMIVVDTIWLLVGISLKKIAFSTTIEQFINITLALTIILAIVMTLLIN